MATLLLTGLSSSSGNYIGLLPGRGLEPLPLLGLLLVVIGGFVLATTYR